MTSQRDGRDNNKQLHAVTNTQSSFVSNLNILIEVLPYLASKIDVVHSMQTSRSLYFIHGPPHLLRNFHHHLCAAKNFPSFSRFIQAPPGRILFLRQLDLSNCDLLTIKRGEQLALILSSATNLRSLALDQCEVIFQDEVIANAVRSLTQLEDISFKDIGQVAAQVIRGMQPSPVSHASFTFIDESLLGHNAFLCNPWLVSGPFKTELTTLDIKKTPCIDIHPGSFIPHHIYYALRKLTLETTHHTLPVAFLSDALPNLKDLSWGLFTPQGALNPKEEILSQEAIVGHWANAHSVSWKNLERLHCSILRAYTLALRTQVNRYDAGTLCSPEWALHLHTVLDSDIRPHILSLSIDIDAVIHSEEFEEDPRSFNNVPKAFITKHGIEVLSLTLELPKYTEMELDTIMDEWVMRILRCARCTFAVLIFKGNCEFRGSEYLGPDARETLDSLDVDQHVNLLPSYLHDIYVIFDTDIRRAELWRRTEYSNDWVDHVLDQVEGAEAAESWEDFQRRFDIHHENVTF